MMARGSVLPRLCCCMVAIVINFQLSCLVGAFETVTLLPSLCGVTAAAGPGQLIRSQSNMESNSLNYTAPISACRYTMTAASSSHKLSFGFGTGYGEVNSVVHDSGCSGANISLLNSDGSTMFAGLCGNLSNSLYTSSGDTLTLEVNSAGGPGTLIGFNAHYTSFYEGNCTDTDGVFACDNGRCIDPSSKCDATLVNNCGDFSDNQAGPPSNCTSETTTAIPTTVAPDAAVDLSWIPYAVIAGLLAGLLIYWKFIKFQYLVWPCCTYPTLICRKLRSCGKSCGKCCNPCNLCKCCRNSTKTPTAGPKSNLLNNGGVGRNGIVKSQPPYGSNGMMMKNGSSFDNAGQMLKSNKVADATGVATGGSNLHLIPPPIGMLRREAHIGSFGGGGKVGGGCDVTIPATVAAESGMFTPGMIKREKHIFSLNTD